MTRAILALLTAVGASAAAVPAASQTPPAARAACRPPLETEDFSGRGPSVPMAALLDSAGLHQALLAAPPAPAEFTLKPVFTLRYDRNGALEAVEPMSERLFPAEYGRTMTALLRAHARPRLPTERRWLQRVWLQSGPTPVIALIDDVADVDPQLINRDSVVQALVQMSRTLPQARPDLAGREVAAILLVTVSADGQPVDAVISRTTGDSWLDCELPTLARAMRFAPATLQGYPVEDGIFVPVTLHFPAAQGRP